MSIKGGFNLLGPIIKTLYKDIKINIPKHYRGEHFKLKGFLI
jgi:hypothetical protein